jgi:nucleoside phosphorylase
MDARTRSHDIYTVGWICALPVETAAAKLMLDKIHPPLPRLPMDQNTYIFGNIGEHNVVIASLPTGAYGNTSAATVGMQLLSSFHAIRFGFMVGIGGGVPSSNADIRLGDIVVSQPTDTSGGVIQYDLGKALSGGQFKRTGILNRPPKILLTALATLQAHHLTEESRIVEFVSNLQATIAPHKAAKFTRPTQEDCLYQAEYDHVASDTCMDCDQSKQVPRTPREHQESVIHYGLIGSANQVVKYGKRRDQLARDLGIYCVEMEAAGLMNDFPCLVIRGICDYADSHKNKEWQGYAAAVAAAYAKELLLAVPVDQVHSAPVACDILADSDVGQEIGSVESLTTREEHSILINSGGGAQTNNVNSGSGQQINNNAHIGTQYIHSGKV